MQENEWDRFDLLNGTIPQRRKWLPTPVFLPGEFHVQRSLAGPSPWGCRIKLTLSPLLFSCYSVDKRKKVKSLNRVRFFATPWTVAYEAPPSMKFSRQEYWSVLPFPSPGDLPNPGIKPGSPALQADALLSEPPRKPSVNITYLISI